jgi:hypothetical protein
MALRQAFRGSRHASPQPPRPVLRRGPQRAVRDAITTLGDIPILRPQAQQAVITSVEEEEAEIDQEEHRPRSRERVDSVPDSGSPSPDRHANFNATSPLRALHLPFRTSRRDSHIQPSSPDHHVGGTAAATPRHETRSVEGLNNTTSQSDHAQGSPHTPQATEPSPAELRGGGRPNSNRVPASNQTPSAPPSRQQVQRDGPELEQSPSPDDVGPESPADEESPMIILKGYFRDPVKHPRGPSYWFHEFRHEQPQTEPRRNRTHRAMPARSLSSGSAPAYSLPIRSARREPSQPEDVFGAPVAYRSPFELESLLSIDQRRSSAAPRQFSSEASASSEAYSFYQMPPESRQPSDEYGQNAQQPPPPYDGTAASRPADRGAYHSVRPSALEAMNNPLRQASSGMNFGTQHGISPLPSLPYTLPQNLRPGQQAFSGGSYIDAATAAISGRVSPLEPFSEHYQHLSEMLNPRQTMPARSSSSQYHPQPNIEPWHNATGPSQLRSMDDRLPQQHPTAPPVGPFTANPSHAPQTTGRGAQATRANQRSSENAPVRPPAQSSGPSRNSQVQIHRAAFERLHNAMQTANVGTIDTAHAGSRSSPSQPATLRHTSNRLRPQDMHSHTNLRAQVRRGTHQTSSSPGRPARPLSSPITATATIPPTIPPRNGSNAHGAGARRRVTPAVRSPTHLHAPRASSAITSLRSPMLRGATSARPLRRVPPQQRDQENSGAAEEHLMRREEAAINARYGDAGQGDVMDETPPRVGRVERRMFS